MPLWECLRVDHPLCNTSVQWFLSAQLPSRNGTWSLCALSFCVAPDSSQLLLLICCHIRSECLFQTSDQSLQIVFVYVTWKRKRVRGSGSVWKRRSEIFWKIRKRVRIGSVYPYVCIYMYIYIYILKYKIFFKKIRNKNYML